jgi:hypothetical protein
MDWDFDVWGSVSWPLDLPAISSTAQNLPVRIDRPGFNESVNFNTTFLKNEFLKFSICTIKAVADTDISIKNSTNT